MKKRNGFVSNSSTCSFQIYGVELDEREVRTMLKNMGNKIEKFLDKYHKDQLRWKPKAERYENLEEFLDENGFYEICDELIPDIRILGEEGVYYYGVDPADMDENETMKQFKDRIKAEIETALGKKVACNFISREYSC